MMKNDISKNGMYTPTCQLWLPGELEDGDRHGGGDDRRPEAEEKDRIPGGQELGTGFPGSSGTRASHKVAK